MATVYSNETKTGDYTWTRVRVDYSGTSATAYLQYKRTNSYYTSTSGGTFTFGGASTSVNVSNTTTNGSFIDIGPKVTFSISTSGGTYSGTSRPNSFTNGGNNFFRGDFSVSIPSQGPSNSAPGTPSVSISQYSSYARVSYSVSSMGYPTSGTLYLYGTSSGSTSYVDYTNGTSSISGSYTFYPSSAGTYYFRSRAANSYAYGAYSGEKSVTFTATAPSSASVSGSVVSQTQINLSFSGSGGSFASNTLYLYGDTSSYPNTLLKSISSSSSSFSHTGLQAGTTYYYRSVYSNSKGSANSSVVSYTTRYAPPNTITASSQNAVTDGVGVSVVKAGSWGENSTAKSFSILNSGKVAIKTIDATSLTSDPISWNIPNSNTNTNTCVVNTWYGRATNSHNEYADSGAYYLATPTAPTVTYFGHTGVAPYLTRNNTVMYTGGNVNSTTANTSTIKQWTFYCTRLSDNVSSTPITRVSTARTESIDYTMDDLTTGSNYTFTTKVSNALGGVGITTSKTYYCPGGVGGRPTVITPDQVELMGSTTSPGGNGDTTSGTISCYQIKWGSTQAELTNSTPIQVSPYFDLINLEPGATYYYQVIAWNTYGLSGISPVMNFTTGGRYLPTVPDYTFTALNPGADITVTIGRSGGVTPNELGINRLTLEMRPEGAEDWEMVSDVDELDLHGGDTYTFKDAWTEQLEESGNYEMKITAYNEYDSGRKIFTLVAPTIQSITTPGVSTSTPTQIKLNVSVAAGTATANRVKISLTGASLDITKTDIVSIAPNTTAVSTVVSPNYLLFDTTYTANATVWDVIGLWNETKNGVNIKTPPRVTWHYVTATSTKQGTPSYRNSGIMKSVTNAYYIVANALGSQPIGTSLNKKRLNFISNPLFYRPESVCSMALSDGSRISFEYDADADTYKFGLWNDSGIQETFFDGENWLMDHYDFGTNSLTITAVTPNGKGVNASSAFSTTTIEEIV